MILSDLTGLVDLTGCPECLEHLLRHPVVEACASVGIEHGKSTRQMLVEYLAYIHSGHRSAP